MVVVIENNIFDGPSGRNGKSRGYIFFRPMVYALYLKNICIFFGQYIFLQLLKN